MPLVLFFKSTVVSPPTTNAYGVAIDGKSLTSLERKLPRAEAFPVKLEPKYIVLIPFFSKNNLIFWQAIVLLPIITLSILENTGLPGFGVSLIFPEIPSIIKFLSFLDTILLLFQILYFTSTFLASSYVVRSGTVRPDAIT